MTLPHLHEESREYVVRRQLIADRSREAGVGPGVGFRARW